MERLKHIKEQIASVVESQLSHLDTVDTKEMGEAIDMIKDLAEACYYCSIVKAMEESDQNRPYQMPMGYQEGRMNGNWSETPMYYDGNSDRMWYGGSSSSGSSGSSSGMSSGGNNARGGGTRGFMSAYPNEIRDYREGRSPVMRRSYMESKEQHRGKEKQMHELEEYMKELSTDVTEMIQGASPEERVMLQQKLRTLSDKVLSQQ